LSGPLVTIRKFSNKRLDLNELIRLGTLSEETVDFLQRCILAQLNILISGGTGTGKTTLRNALSQAAAASERSVTIEGRAASAVFDRLVRAIRQQLASALHRIIPRERLQDGTRRVTAITEVQRMESDVITLQDLFEFRVERVTPEQVVIGELGATGLRPTFL